MRFAGIGFQVFRPGNRIHVSPEHPGNTFVFARTWRCSGWSRVVQVSYDARCIGEEVESEDTDEDWGGEQCADDTDRKYTYEVWGEEQCVDDTDRKSKKHKSDKEKRKKDVGHRTNIEHPHGALLRWSGGEGVGGGRGGGGANSHTNASIPS